MVFDWLDLPFRVKDSGFDLAFLYLTRPSELWFDVGKTNPDQGTKAVRSTGLEAFRLGAPRGVAKPTPSAPCFMCQAPLRREPPFF